MKTKFSLWILAMMVFLSGCASFRTASEVQSGRQALFRGNNEAALGYFQSAAQKNPNYVYGTALRQGVWTYVGRAEYATGRYPQARESLERALKLDREDNLARLYLGLTLARQGDRNKGLSEIQNGMKGINDWLEYITQAHRFSFGQYWDPVREIRNAIQGDLAMISGKDVDWQKLIPSGEWVGQRMEEEAERAQRQESEDMSRDGEGRGDRP